MTGSRSALRYRADIDGLRAVAVLPVVFYHFRIAPFTGGFVGVDIFFVISGFLITSLIHEEMRDGAFSIARFYERRIRRILPALFIVLAVTSILALVILFPSDLKRYGESLLATTVMGSNFHFFSKIGYFDQIAERKPLLHTWSLAVEEQYYLIFPALLVFIRRLGERGLVLIIAGIFVASLAANIWAVRAAPAADFYLLPFRMWELMLGALIALGAVPAVTNALARNAIAAAGAALISASVFLFTVETPFPGENALLPCLGAGCLIFAAPGTLVGRALSWRPIVTVGFISYSLYLWHWPLLVMARFVLVRDLVSYEKGVLILVCGLLAILSWQYVERPFRARGTISRKRVFQIAAASALVLIGAGAADKVGNGLPGRYSKATLKILAAADEIPVPKNCRGQPAEAVRRGELCRFGATTAAAPTFLVWGDSHAEALMPAAADAGTATGRAGLLATHGACPPLLGTTNTRAKGCREFNDAVLALAKTPAITTVILIAQWAWYVEGVQAPHGEGGPLDLMDAQSPKPSRQNDPAVFTRGLARTIDALVFMGKTVVIIGPVPEVGPPVPETWAALKIFGQERDIRPDLSAFLARERRVLPILAAASARAHVSIVSPQSVLCGAAKCEVMKDGQALYKDGHHLTHLGAATLVPLLRAKL